MFKVIEMGTLIQKFCFWQVQHIQGLPKDWEEKVDKVHQLFSRVPHYNKVRLLKVYLLNFRKSINLLSDDWFLLLLQNLKQYELDYRDRGRAGLRIQSSVKNFQLTLEVLLTTLIYDFSDKHLNYATQLPRYILVSSISFSRSGFELVHLTLYIMLYHLNFLKDVPTLASCTLLDASNLNLDYKMNAIHFEWNGEDPCPERRCLI